MSGFAPSVEAARKALGSSVPIETRMHPPGGAGVKFSLDEVCRRAAKGRNDPRVRAWAIRSIQAAGSPSGMIDQARAILAAFKKACAYVQDPLNTEFIQAAHETLCLDDKGLCFRGGDCDDVCVAYAAATMSVGIPTNIVGQAFKDSGVPGHVIAAVRDVKDKYNTWLRVDPSSDKPVGESYTAVREWWIDPLDPNDKTSSTIAGAGDFVGVGTVPEGHGARQGATGLGDSLPAQAASAVTQQVQAALSSLTSSANNLAAVLDQLDQIKSQVGYDPEPSTPITGLSDFPTTGVWTLSMDKATKDLLSQANFLITAMNDGINGVRSIFVDPSSSEIGFGSIASDPYTWRVVLTTAVDSIIGIFSPAGALLIGITAQLGEVLTPSEVQAKIAAAPSGTIQGVGAPVLWIAGAAVVVTLAVVYAYVRYLSAALATAQEATKQAMIAYCNQQTKAGAMTASQCAQWLNQYQKLMNDAQAQTDKDNPFAAGIDSVTNALKWTLLGVGLIGGGVLLWPVLQEAAQSTALVLRSKRESR